jgi:hypothetical protein
MEKYAIRTYPPDGAPDALRARSKARGRHLPEDAYK